MDKQTANKKLKELRDSLSEVLEGKSYSSSEEIKKQSTEAIKSARKAGTALKKSLAERIKDLPIVQKVTELGTAGSVAVGTAAVAQTTVAIDQTEVFVASVANDIVEERIEVPMFIDTFVDFHVLNDWGQVVMAEKVEAAQEFVQKAEAIALPSSSKNETSAEKETKPSNASASDGEVEKKPTDKQPEKESEKEAKEVKKDSPKTNDSKEDKSHKPKQPQEQKVEDEKESRKSVSSLEDGTKSEDVKEEPPIIETPIDDDPLIRQVSPTI